MISGNFPNSTYHLPLVRMGLQNGGARPDDLTALTSAIARGANSKQASLWRRAVRRLREGALAGRLTRPIDIEDEPLPATAIENATWLFLRQRSGQQIFQELGSQGFDAGLIQSGEKTTQGRASRQSLAFEHRHERGGKREQTLVERFESGFAADGIA